MSFDFTLSKYRELCEAILMNDYRILRFDNYLRSAGMHKRFVILRHDVDLAPIKALRMAKLENELDIASTYYFRYPKTFVPNIIRRIYELNHEIGYHYEVLSKTKGDFEAGIELFAKDLQRFQRVVSIKTICMHGSPLSGWDSRDLWLKYNMQDFGIIGEPYLSIDYTKVLYLTDTGRRWNGTNANIRDKVDSKFNYRLKNTNAVITAFKGKDLPTQMIINIHPARWNDALFDWGAELIGQNVKNLVKASLIKRRHNLCE